ncbi:extracellular solute-binding protein [Micrococcaceae bacterium Sec5.1]
MSFTSRAKRYVPALAIPVVAALVITGCGSSDSGTSGGSDAQLTIADYGGKLSKTMNTTFLEPYSAESGVKFTQDPNMDNNKIALQVQSGNIQWDMAEVDTWLATQQCGKQFEEIDADALDTSKFAEGRVTNKCGLPVLEWGAVLAYDKTKFGDNPPTSWADFFDTQKYPGKRCAPTTSQFNMEAASLASGVKPENLYPLDVMTAINKYQTIKQDTTFLTSSTQQVDTMLSGGAVMCMVYSPRAFDAISQGAKWDVVWPTVLKQWDSLVILKGSPNAGPAKKFLSWLSNNPEAQTKFEELAPYASTAAKSGEPKVSDLQAQYLVSNHRNDGVALDNEWYAQNKDAAESQWRAALVG